MPKIGDVAVCTLGHTGLITGSMTRQGNQIYMGVTLLPKELTGFAWQSVQPRVIGRIEQFIPEEVPNATPAPPGA